MPAGQLARFRKPFGKWARKSFILRVGPVERWLLQKQCFRYLPSEGFAPVELSRITTAPQVRLSAVHHDAQDGETVFPASEAGLGLRAFFPRGMLSPFHRGPHP